MMFAKKEFTHLRIKQMEHEDNHEKLSRDFGYTKPKDNEKISDS